MQGHPPDRSTSRVTYVLGREHSGDVDFGVVTPDGMHGIFYLGRTGEIASLSADKTHNGMLTQQKCGFACTTRVINSHSSACTHDSQ